MICCCRHLLRHCRFVWATDKQTKLSSQHLPKDQHTHAKSSTSPGKYYKNALLSHQGQCCIDDRFCVIRINCHLSRDGYEIRHFFVKASWYGYRLVLWSYGNVIGDGGFSSASSDALRPICLVPAFFDDEHVVDPFVVKLRSKTKSLVKGHMFGPHLVEVRSVTKSSNKGHIFGPHLVEVHSETKSSGERHIGKRW